jgi:hypothetical protein
MKKYPRYGIRVSEELGAALRRVGPERVREVLREVFLGKKGMGVPSWSKGKVESVEEVPEPADVVTEAPQMTGMDVLRAITAGQVKMPVSAPEEVVTPPAMKMQQQMVKPPDFHPDPEYDD